MLYQVHRLGPTTSSYYIVRFTHTCTHTSHILLVERGTWNLRSSVVHTGTYLYGVFYKRYNFNIGTVIMVQINKIYIVVVVCHVVCKTYMCTYVYVVRIVLYTYMYDTMYVVCMYVCVTCNTFVSL